MQITVENGPLAGTKIPLERDRQVTLGSAPDCDLHLDDPAVAERHAVVKALKGEGFGVKALAAGLKVNGREVTAAPLEDGDRLQIGTTEFRFSTAGKASDTPIPGFRILGILGKGGMGVVYRAEQLSLHREVALKVLSRELTKDPAFVARFVAEARAAARLSHPNVVQVFDVDHSGDTYYYSMEVMHEGSLEGWLKQHGRMPVEQALQVVADAASGLAYAESLGIVHRDIKPDNLMLDQHGTVKIADLGLAHTEEDPEEKLTGTPHFMAPEQILRRGVDHRTDLYALGCTFYRLVTGRTPFRGGTVKEILKAHVKEAPEPPHKADGDVPPEVSAIVLKLMAKEPGERYQSANELLADLHRLLSPPARRGLWIGLAAAAVLVAGGVLVWALTRPDPEATIEVRYRDNPEALRLATENEQLQAQAREDRAEIALLRVQLRSLAEAEQAAALETVARDHPGTRSGSEAERLAQSLRAGLARRAATAAARAQQIEGAIAGLRASIDAALERRAWSEALAALQQAPPAEVAGTPEWTAATAAQQQRVQQAATAHLESLRGAVQQSSQQADAAAVEQAVAALAGALGEGGVPPALIAEPATWQQAVADGRAAAERLRTARAEQQWSSYESLVRGEDGLLRLLGRLDFARAADKANTLGERFGSEPVGARAGHLAEALRTAETFAAALQAAADAGRLTVPMGDGVPQSVARWQRAGAAPALVVLDQSRRPAREVTVPQDTLTVEQWTALTQQVAGTAPGGAECFLAFTALASHAQRARAYLGAIDPAQDQSGTGEQGYPLGADAFELLLRRLPEEGSTPWAGWLRGEVQAGRLLAAGLRAFSERRNRAAAAHLERLTKEFPHSLLVAALP